MNRYRGLVVDFGGVLTTSLRESFLRFCEKEGVKPQTLVELLESSYPSQDPDSIVTLVETGRMSPEEFERQLADVLSRGLHLPVAADGLLDRMGESLELEPRMVDAVRRIREGGVGTALLSNSWGIDYYPHDLLAELFDEVVISGQVGLRKPDEEIYHLAVDGLGVPAPECVFVDDLEVNIDTAERVGMRGLHHEHPGETIGELERLFDVDLGAATGS
jgi:epoxide hydrolase-like predicted phosphatase